MRNYLIIDGMDSTDFGLYVSGPGTFSAPAREVQTLQIPGRSGDMILTANRLQNYDLVYPAFICRDFERNIENLRNFLLSRTSYFRLEDSYHTDEYRQAMYVGPFEPDVTQRLRAAKFDLVFNVKPQRFLKSGEKPRQLGAADTYVLRNPTQFIARPILRLYGNGTFRLNTMNYFTVTNNADTYVDIDCEMMMCHTGPTDRNADVTVPGTDTPVLLPGLNYLLFTGFTDIYITPRWWIV